MPHLQVCALSRLAEVAAATRAGSVITLLSPGGTAAVRPSAIPQERHLVLAVSDIVVARDGLSAPDPGHVAAMLAFFKAWDRQAPLLIHCYAGVSRSTAAAFIGICALNPGLPEQTVADRLRAASPTATPNGRLVELADAQLGRGGRMVAAVAAIGRGADCFEGDPFRLDLA